MAEARSRPRVLLIGANGQVGWELRRTLLPLGDVFAATRDDADLGDAAALRRLVGEVRPNLVVNAAAFTAVDLAEKEAALAFAINADAPRVLAEEAARLGAALVHFSTDYVFDGTADSPYSEHDAAHPLNVYGESKLKGEQAVAAVGGDSVVLRTGWVYGLRGRNFLLTMLRLAREREEIRVVDDQVGAPTWSRALAEATAQMLARHAFEGGFSLPPHLRGVYHLGAGGQATWYEFARAILDLDPQRPAQRCRDLIAIPTQEYPTPAARPRYSVLDSSRFHSAFGLRLPHWRDLLSLAFDAAPAGRP